MSRRRRFLAAASASALAVPLGVAFPGAAGATAYPAVTLTDTAQTATWSGEFVAGAVGVWPVVSLPDACTPELCDVVPVDIQLPAGTWAKRPGGLLVAIRQPVLETAANDIDLFVYGPDHALVASKSAPVMNEAVWVPNPVNGRYQVVVVPKLVVSQPVVEGVFEPVRYDGFIEFERGRTVERDETNLGQPYWHQFVAFGHTSSTRARELLPDLVPTTPRNFHIESTAGVAAYFYVDRGLRHQPSCYPWETSGLTDDDPAPADGPLRCLRFDQGEYNLGDGPLELHVYQGTSEAYQRIYASDGSVRQVGPMGEVQFSDSHGHFHYRGFQDVQLYRIADGGSLEFVTDGVGKGICMGDVEMYSFGRSDGPISPLGYPVFGGTCDVATHQDPNDPTFPNTDYFEMGISVGWADVYPWFIADQYVDITDAPDGKYAVVVRQDVNGRVVEKDTTNNTAIGCVEITGDVAADIPCGAVELP